MKRPFGITHALCVVWLLASSLSLGHEGHDHSPGDPSVRTWTMKGTGQHLHAAFVASLDEKVQVRRPDGQIVSLELAALVDSDRQWVAQRLAQIRDLNETSDSLNRERLITIKTGKTASIADTFAPFAKLNALKYRQDERFFYVESNSMPDHRMMVGITAWQQQVPIPQPYFGDNAWRIPLEPVVAQQPLSAKSHFFRGAIALAANGVPIFNPIKNDGRTDTFLAGELDEFGGHCGRADDYHYHIAPTHLQKIVGQDKPVAYALDGYAIYGFTEPDGSKVENLDEFNGHSTTELGYHYHATKTYPYLNGGFHGEVVERDGQVDPQPRTGGVRPAMPPLRGAKITGFESKSNKSFSVKIQVGNETRYVNYVLGDNGSVKFDFVDGTGKITSETYSPRQRGPGQGSDGGAGRPGGERGQGGRQGGSPEGAGRRGPEGAAKGSGGGQRPPRNSDQEDPKPSGDRGGRRQPANEGRSSRPEAEPTNDNRTAKRNPESSQQSPAAPLILSPTKSGKLKLTSPILVDGDPLPDEFNGNGAGATLPLQWQGAPEGTKSFALIMDHIDRDNVLKTYWNLYAIPPDVTSLPKNVKGVGKIGATWKRDQAYVPPHSAGGATQTYTIHLYALSEIPAFDESERSVTREALLNQIKNSILDSAELNVTYTRPRDSASTGAADKSGRKDRNRGEPR